MILFSFAQNLRAWNSHSSYDISNRNFPSSDIDDCDFDGRRNTSPVTFPREKLLPTDKEITFHHELRTPLRGLWNDIRDGKRKRMTSTIQHIFGSSVFRRDACVIAIMPSYDIGTREVRTFLILLAQIA